MRLDFDRVTLDFHPSEDGASEDGSGAGGAVAVLTFNHPEVMNAIGAEMLGGLHAAIGAVQDPANNVRCLLVTGAGRGFCAGANLADPARGSGAGSSLRGGYHPLLLALRDLDMPFVSAVNGAAAGVGMSFAIMADIVCASRPAFFLQAFARIGLVPDGGATFLLPRLIGWGRAMELSLLAERLPAQKAAEWGLVNRLYEDNAALLEGALGIARQLAAGPKSLALIRRLYWSSWHNAYEQQLDLEARMQAAAGETEDHREGVRAFFEKRTARFQGR